MALRMTNFENHKYFNTYESSLVFKIFLFNFVNTFNSFLILAFFTSFFPGLDLCLVDPPKDYLDGNNYMSNIYDQLGLPKRSTAETDVFSYNNCFSSL